MSMNATFVQVDEAEMSRLRADPSLAETLFQAGAVLPPAFAALAHRLQPAGRQQLADALSRLDPRLRQQIEASMGRVSAALAADPEAISKLTKDRRGSGSVSARAVLSLDKAWHGVHYLLCGEVEPGATRISQAVLGGTELGDGEGFSGYGPARYFSTAQVRELSQALSRPELESEAAARFDAARMMQLRIYPGWQASDAEWVMDGFRRLREFYWDAAGKGRAIVTCLV